MVAQEKSSNGQSSRSEHTAPPPQNKFRVKEIKLEKEKKRGTMKMARHTKRVQRCLCKRFSPPPPPMNKKEFWAKLELMNKFSAKLEEENRKKNKKNKKNKKGDSNKDTKKVEKKTLGLLQ